MATKKCKNGHIYDEAVYGDKCPFCPLPDEKGIDGGPCIYPGKEKMLNN